MLDETEKFTTIAPVIATATVEVVNAADAPGRPRRGRCHLDGSPPGKGVYLKNVSVSLPPRDVAMLEEIGHGNRSVAVRLLLEAWRELDGPVSVAHQVAEQNRPTRQRMGGRREPVPASP